MELLYIWIDSYKNIKQQGFNFSPKYRFEFTPTTFGKDEEGNETVIGGDLTYQENKDFPDNFFGKGISNVTAIIGENGSGKSSVLELIKDIKELLYINIFYVFKEDQFSIIIRKKSSINLNIISIGFEFSYSERNDNDTLDSDFCYYPYSAFDIRNYNTLLGSSGNNYDISTTNLLGIAQTLQGYQFEELKKQVFFIGKNDTIREILFGDGKNISIQISLNNVISGKMGVYISPKLYLKTSDYIKAIYVLWAYEDSLKFNKIDGYEQEVEELMKSGDNINNRIDKLATIINNKGGIKSIGGREIDYRTLNFNGLSEWFAINIDSYSNGFLNSENKIYLNLVSKPDLGKIMDLIIICEKIPFDIFGFDFIIGEKKQERNLSSGENALLSLFARLDNNYSTNSYAKDCSYMIALFDEPDLCLHPQWQKDLLKKILDILPKIFRNKPIQIILTSHSPFLVSDLPKENIIFLEKEKETGLCKVSDLRNHAQTFGQNIHTLFADSFFMEGGLIGEFAKTKLEQAIQWLKSNESLTEKEINELKFIITHFGEPMIKHKLEQLYEKRFLAKIDETLESKIDRLKRELAEAEKVQQQNKPIL
jgi:ABC-type multidrug transport system ATPase subunit